MSMRGHEKRVPRFQSRSARDADRGRSLKCMPPLFFGPDPKTHGRDNSDDDCVQLCSRPRERTKLYLCACVCARVHTRAEWDSCVTCVWCVSCVHTHHTCASALIPAEGSIGISRVSVGRAAGIGGTGAGAANGRAGLRRLAVVAVARVDGNGGRSLNNLFLNWVGKRGVGGISILMGVSRVFFLRWKKGCLEFYCDFIVQE